MISTILGSFRVGEIRKKLLFTAAVLGLYRLGTHIPAPGINAQAVKAIQSADALLYDALIDPAILDLARPEARRIDVGKRCGRHAMNQAAMNPTHQVARNPTSPTKTGEGAKSIAPVGEVRVLTASVAVAAVALVIVEPPSTAENPEINPPGVNPFEGPSAGTVVL